MKLLYKCKFCNNDYSKYGIKNHEILCKLNPDRNLVNVCHSKFKCKLCKAEFDTKHELYQHKIHIHDIHTNGGQQPKYVLTCKYCNISKIITKAAMTKHELHCDKNPNKVICIGHKVTEKTKQKISKGMILAHKEGRASSWIGRRKRSYAEQSWFNIFTNANIKFENNYYVQPYWLDFAWPENKLYFEVDGQTHLTTEGAEHDNKRTEFLQMQGWTLLERCNWSEYQKLSKSDKERYIANILEKI